MKFPIYLPITILVCLGLCASVNAQSMEKLTPELLKEMAAQRAGGGERQDLVREVFDSGRTDLICVLVGAPNYYGYVVLAVEEMAESPFKDEVILSLMEEPWLVDDGPYGKMPGSRGLPRMEQAAIKVIARILPAQNLDPDDFQAIRRFQARSERVKLVAEARRVLGEKKVSAPAPRQAESTAPNGDAGSPITVAKPPAVAAIEEKAAVVDMKWPAWGAVAVAISAVVWLILRKRR